MKPLKKIETITTLQYYYVIGKFGQVSFQRIACIFPHGFTRREAEELYQSHRFVNLKRYAGRAIMLGKDRVVHGETIGWPYDIRIHRDGSIEKAE